MHNQTSLSQSSMGEYPRYKGGHRTPRANRSNDRCKQKEAEASREVIGECKVKEQEQEHRTTHAAGS